MFHQMLALQSIYEESDFSWETLLSLSFFYCPLTLCQMSDKPYERFIRNYESDMQALLQ